MLWKYFLCKVCKLNFGQKRESKCHIYSSRIHAKHNFPALITGLIDDDLSQVDTQENIIPPYITLCTFAQLKPANLTHRVVKLLLAKAYPIVIHYYWSITTTTKWRVLMTYIKWCTLSGPNSQNLILNIFQLLSFKSFTKMYFEN